MKRAAVSGRQLIAIMAKAPRAGRVKTRLSPPLSRRTAAELARALLCDTVRQVKQVRRARGVIVYSPPTARRVFRRLAPTFLLVAQPAGDLGRRLHVSFARLLRPGVRSAVVIGSDIPSVPTRFLERALIALDDPRTDVVLGPTEDGGYYLIGLKRACVDLFTGIAWGTARVFDQTLRRARARRLRVTILPRCWDIDTPEDLSRLRRWLVRRPGNELRHTRRVLASPGVRMVDS